MTPNRADILPEDQLLLLASQGDRAAFAMIYERCWPVLYRAVFLFVPVKEETEEILQDIFVKLWERKDLLGQINSIDNYLFRMAKNAVGMRARHNQVKDKVLAKLADLTVSNPLPDDDLIYKEYHQAAATAIAQLSERRREIFLLRTQSDLSLDEIAFKLGISVSAVKKQLYESIKLIKDHLSDTQSFTGLLLFSILVDSLF